MDELEYLMRQIVRNQSSLTQIVISTDQFTALTDLVSSVCELARQKAETISSLTKQLKQKALENEGLTKDSQFFAKHLEKIKADIGESISSVRREVQAESTISEKWLKELRREREKNEFLEATLRDYSSKVASLRAEINVSRQQVDWCCSEKMKAEANFQTLNESFEKYKASTQEFRDQVKTLKAQLEKANVSNEMEMKAKETNHSKDIKTLKEENKDLVERLKEKADLCLMVEDELLGLREEVKKQKASTEKLSKEKLKFTDELEKAKNKIKSLQEEINTMKNEQKTKTKDEKGITNRLQKLEDENKKLAEQLEVAASIKLELEAKLDSLNTKLPAKSKSTSRLDKEAKHEEESLAKRYKTLEDLVYQGTTTKYKDKSALLKDIFNKDELDVPRIKMNYLDMLRVVEEMNKKGDAKHKKEHSGDYMNAGMDIEKPQTAIMDNQRRMSTPDKLANQPIQAFPDNDTAFKNMKCLHTTHYPGCTYCELLQKEEKQKQIPLRHGKLKKGG